MIGRPSSFSGALDNIDNLRRGNIKFDAQSQQMTYQEQPVDNRTWLGGRFFLNVMESLISPIEETCMGHVRRLKNI